MTTIVSAFLSNVNNRKDRNIEKYYSLGKLLLKSKTPKIIFLDENMMRLLNENDYNKENTVIMQYNKDKCYLYGYLEKITKFKLNTDNKNKDTLEYLFTQCNKTEWIRDAIKLNPFNTSNFVWIDLSIRHISSCSEEEFVLELDNLASKEYEKVRIGSIWDLKYKCNNDILTNVAWYFAGGVFGGNKDKLIEFADLVKKKCEEIINKYNTLTWEVNIWYMLCTENSDLFDSYSCRFNDTLINRY